MELEERTETILIDPEREFGRTQRHDVARLREHADHIGTALGREDVDLDRDHAAVAVTDRGLEMVDPGGQRRLESAVHPLPVVGMHVEAVVSAEHLARIVAGQLGRLVGADKATVAVVQDDRVGGAGVERVEDHSRIVEVHS